MSDKSDFLKITVDIVSAYVHAHKVRTAELPDIIGTVHASLTRLGTLRPTEAPALELTPAVPIRRSITPNYLICLDDGKQFKSLRRHLGRLGMTPDEYRAKWGLPDDYPMVAPDYAAMRSEVARATGLGTRRRTLPMANRLRDHTVSSAVQLEPATSAPVTAEMQLEPEHSTWRRGRPAKDM